MISSVWVEFSAPAHHRFPGDEIRFSAIDEGLTSRDELVEKITQLLTPYGIKIQRQGL